MSDHQDSAPAEQGAVIHLPPIVAETPLELESSKTSGVWLLLAILGVFVGVLSFFPARTPDVLLSLAYGRGLADGSITLGAEPFSYALGSYWANPHWLFDLVAFGIYQADGQAGFLLIAGKTAVLVIAMVLLAWRFSRENSWAASILILATAVGALAASPYFDVSPSMIGFPLTALLLSILTLDANAWRTVRMVGLPLTMLLWVNLDSSFLFGLVVWILWFVIPGNEKRGSGELRLLAFGVAALLVTPFHVRSFMALPEILAPVGEVADRMDPLVIERLLDSGFSIQRFTETQLALNPAGLAFPILLAISLASFVVHPKALLSWRFVAIVLATGLAAYRHKAIPWFAAIGTIVSCLNLIDGLGSIKAWRLMVGRGAILSFLLLMGASLIGLPGFLHASGARSTPRLPGWGLALRESNRELALGMAQTPKTDGSNWLVASLSYPDQASYVAWFAPGIRTFVDTRLHLFASEYRSFADTVEALGKPDSAANLPGTDWRELLARHGIKHVAATLRAGDSSKRVLIRLMQDSEWQQPNYYGSWLVGTLRAKPVLADAREKEGKRFIASLVDVSAGAALQQGMPTMVNTYSAWEFWQPRNEPGARSDSAELIQTMSESMPALPRFGSLARALAEARRGLHEVPDSVRSHEITLNALASYSDMAGVAGRPTLLADLQEIEIVALCRRIITLKPQGAESLKAHGILAEVASKRRFLDMEVLHREEVLKLGRQFVSRMADSPTDAPGNNNRDIAAKDLDKASNQLDKLQGLLNRQKDMFANEVTRIQKTAQREAGGLEKAMVALQLGLLFEAQKELDSPVTADQVQKNDRERSSFVLLNLQLDLQTGRLDNAREALNSDGVRAAMENAGRPIPHPGLLIPELLDSRNIHPDRRFRALPWLEVQLAAAQGDYSQASRLLGAIATEQGDLFAPSIQQRTPFQLKQGFALAMLARDSRSMEAVSFGSSLSFKADTLFAMPWLVTLLDTLAMIEQDHEERLRVPPAFLAELKVAAGNYAYLSGNPTDARRQVKQALLLATHAGQIRAQATRLMASNFWAENILQNAVTDRLQNIFTPLTPCADTARRLELLMELTMDQ